MILFMISCTPFKEAYIYIHLAAKRLCTAGLKVGGEGLESIGTHHANRSSEAAQHYRNLNRRASSVALQSNASLLCIYTVYIVFYTMNTSAIGWKTELPKSFIVLFLRYVTVETEWEFF